MRGRYFLFLIFLLLGIFAFSFYRIKCQSLKTYPAVVEENKESCEAKGGKWEIVGAWQKEQCNLPTLDGGKDCSDSQDCEGKCIADLSEEEKREVYLRPIKKKGRCTSWKIVVGCFNFVEKGEVTPQRCVD